MYRWLGASATPRLASMLSRAAERPAIEALLSGQRRQAIVPAIRGFLSEPIHPENLANLQAPTLILTHPDDALHPLRSGEILRACLPRAKLLVAPSRSYWQENRAALLHVVVASLRGQGVTGAA